MNTNRWADHPSYQQENNGMGMCNTKANAPGHCRLGGIGCDVDHIMVKMITTTNTDERDHWIRMFNRLEVAITHHRKGRDPNWEDEVDQALYAARDRILRDAKATP